MSDLGPDGKIMIELSENRINASKVDFDRKYANLTQLRLSDDAGQSGNIPPDFYNQKINNQKYQ